MPTKQRSESFASTTIECARAPEGQPAIDGSPQVSPSNACVNESTALQVAPPSRLRNRAAGTVPA